MPFSQFRFDPSLLATIAEEGYSTPSPIQVQAIPVVMEGGDLFGLAQNTSWRGRYFWCVGFQPQKDALARRPEIHC